MSRAAIRVQQASQALKSWEPGTPFSLHFKQLSRQNKNWGGRDRKEIQALCYAWFRLGRASRLFPSAEVAIPWAAYLYLPDRTDWIASYKEEGTLHLDLIEEEAFSTRFGHFCTQFSWSDPLFPEADQLSETFPVTGLDAALAIPARLWFRVKKTTLREFTAQLTKSSIPFEQDGLAIGMEGRTSLDQLFGDRLSSFGEVQDWASQQVIRSFDWTGQRVWDACSGSGGKAIQITEEFTPAYLLCTDIRPAILQNLQQRFKKSGNRVPDIQVINLSLNRLEKAKVLFDAILCDVPCTGSGTFRRNPEGMQSVSKDEIKRYTTLQEKIVSNTLSALKRDGHLLYSTCSVYQAENEGHLKRFATMGLELVKAEYIDGREMGGDILYYALFKKA